MKHLFACFLVALLAVLCPYFFEWDYMTAKADDYISNTVDYSKPDDVFEALCQYYDIDTADYYYYYCPSYLLGSSEKLAWCMILRSKENPYYAQSLDVYAYSSEDEKITYFMQGDFGCFFRQAENFSMMFGSQFPSWGSRSNVQDSDWGSGKLDLPVAVYSNAPTIEGYRNTTSCPDSKTFKLFSASAEYGESNATGLLLSYWSQFGFKPIKAELVKGTDVINIPILKSGESVSSSGYYVRLLEDNYAYRFRLSRSPDVSVNYLDYDVRITFDTVPNSENFTVAGLTVDLGENSASKLSPSVAFAYGGTLYGGNEIVDYNEYYGLGTIQTISYNSANTLTMTYTWYNTDFQKVYDCIFGVVDYNVLTGTDTNPDTGETINTYAPVSTSNDYSTHVTNTVNNSIVGLTGTDSGAGSFSADWSGTSPDGNFTYDDTFTFNDGGLKSFFTRIWTVGDGFFASALLGVLSIAFAAYLLYGKR